MVKKIQKGVIAAAGLGSRFLPFVKACPKALVPILNKPTIQYLIEEMLANGINEIAIIHNHHDNRIEQYFAPNRQLEQELKKINKINYLDSLKTIQQQAKLTFIPQDQQLPYGNATPALTAKNFVKNQPFAYFFGDDLIIEPTTGNFLAELIKKFYHYHAKLVLGAQKVSRQEIGAVSSIKYANNKQCPYQIQNIIEKPKPEEIYSNFAQFGRFVLDPIIFETLAKLPVRNGELWFTDGVNLLAQTELVIGQPIINGQWITTGDPNHWLKANLLISKLSV